MNVLITDFLELKIAADAAEVGAFSGYGSTFGNVDQGKDKCMKGCFMESLKSGLPAMFWQHDPGEPIGEWTEVQEDGKGLKVSGKLWLGKGIPKAEQAYLMLKANGPKGLSIGYRTRNSTYDEKTGVRSLVQVDLKEISVVSFPMNEKAKIVSIKSQLTDGIVPTARDVEEILRDAGFSAKRAKAFMADGYKGIARDEQPSAVSAEIAQLIRNIHKNLNPSA